MSFQTILERVFLKSIDSVKPAQLIRSAVFLQNHTLVIKNLSIPVNKNCYVVGFGKAAYEMATGIENILGDHIQAGIISIPKGSRTWPGQHVHEKTRIRVIEGASNNLPDLNAQRAATDIKNLAELLTEKDIFLVLISGGGSALLTAPKKPVTLDEKIQTIKLLVSVGADITELNSVRKALSDLKGGKLAAYAYPAITISLIISDIIDDPLEFIASGPTVLSYENYNQNAITVLKKYNLLDKVPLNVRKVLNEVCDERWESIQFNSFSPHNFLIGNNSIALGTAKSELERINLVGLALVLSSRVYGLTSEITLIYSEIIKIICEFVTSIGSKTEFLTRIDQFAATFKTFKYISDFSRIIIENIDHIESSISNDKCLILICGGEPTVKIRGKGSGGRNQQLALEIALKLHQLRENYDFMREFEVSFLSAGTDGIDGPTDAAGAFVNSNLIDDTMSSNLDAESYLKNNDSYTFFYKFRNQKNHFVIGQTGTNVMDLHFLLIRRN